VKAEEAIGGQSASNPAGEGKAEIEVRCHSSWKILRRRGDRTLSRNGCGIQSGALNR
jgi:hypothetical protein